MNLIKYVLPKFLFRGIIMYLNYILIYSKDYGSHVTLVREVFKTLYQHILFAKLSKFEFHKSKMNFLGN